MKNIELGSQVRINIPKGSPCHDFDGLKGIVVQIRNLRGMYLVRTKKGYIHCSRHELTLLVGAGSSIETRSTSSSGAEKGVKPETFSLIPVEALEQVARHYGEGAKKYAPHNWRAGYEWSKSYDALQRHANAFWRGEDTDAETGSPHMAAVAFHALTLLTFMQEQPEYDDRYKEQNK